MTNLIEGTSRPLCAATVPADQFHCVLDDLPMHLLPGRVRRSWSFEESEAKPVYLNPECLVCGAGELPEELQGQNDLLSGLALESTIAWVRDPATRSLLPFWLGPELDDTLHSLQADGSAASQLRGDVRALLLHAGILVSQDHNMKRFRAWGATLNASSPRFREKGYAPLAGLIHPFHVAALRRYYRQRIRSGALKLGDRQSTRRYVSYNDPVARFFHQHITATLSAVAGEPLMPSYVYMASYLSGAELKKHTDRAQCEFSVTLCLDFSPEPAGETPWPIQLETPAGSVAVYQGIGDGLAYRGTRVPHYRSMLGEGMTSTSIFFHYVPEDFEGPLE